MLRGLGWPRGHVRRSKLRNFYSFDFVKYIDIMAIKMEERKDVFGRHTYKVN